MAGYKQYTQKALKQLAIDGMATDITRYDELQLRTLMARHNLDRVGVSIGKYGINGGLLKSLTTGEFFVITARNSVLTIMF